MVCGQGETASKRAIAQLEENGFRWRKLVRRDDRLRTVTMVNDLPG